jgi:hypothetical protein
VSFARGYIRNPDGHVAGIRFEHHLAAWTPTPSSVDLRSHAPAVKNQNACSSCCGHGTSTGISTTCRAQGRPLPFEPSERGIYAVGRCIDRAPGTPLADDGAMPHQVMRGISAWGVRPTKAPTSTGLNSDCEPSNVNDEPKLGELQQDAKALIVGEYAITATGAARVQQIRQALAAGFAVCFGVDVDAAFEAYDGTHVIGAPDPKQILGGHWLCAVGYRTDATGKTIVIFRNSWDVSWGIAGDGEGDEAFIAGMSDITVMNVREAA